MNKAKCYIYTRVSTAMQVDGFSLDAQKEKLHRYAEYNDMEVVGEYSDEGKSGKNVEGRIDFVKMLNDIENRKDDISFVLVFKLSRFGRNAADVLSSLQTMQDYGVNLICVEDGIDSSKESGKLVISVLSAVAEIERENILVQTMEGRKQKAREGKWNGGFAPYGYKLENGSLFVEEKEAETVRIIFDKYAHTSMGLSAVATYMNNHGYEKIMRHNAKLNKFSTGFIKHVLDNPIYTGRIAYGRRSHEKIVGKRNEYHVVKQDNYGLYEGEHEAIISDELFEIVKQKRNNNNMGWNKTHSLDHEHVLSGILKCPMCGSPMYGNVNRKKRKDGSYNDYWYYVCRHRRHETGIHCDYHKQWKQDLIDGAVMELIQKMVITPQFTEAIKKKIESRINTDDLEKEVKMLKKQLTQLSGTKDRLNYQIDHLDLSDKHYDRKFDDLQSRTDKIYDEIEDIENEIFDIEARIQNVKENKIKAEGVYKILEHFDKIYEKATDKEKKEFMHLFLEKVEIFPEKLKNGKIIKQIHFNFPVMLEGEEIFGIGWNSESRGETGDIVETEVVQLTRRSFLSKFNKKT